TPRALGDARTVLQAGPLQPGYVSLSGLPDHRNALVFEPKGERYRFEVFRLLGTGSRVVVITPSAFQRADFSNTFTGRLRPLSDLPFAATLRDFYGHRMRTL